MKLPEFANVKSTDLLHSKRIEVEKPEKNFRAAVCKIFQQK